MGADPYQGLLKSDSQTQPGQTWSWKPTECKWFNSTSVWLKELGWHKTVTHTEERCGFFPPKRLHWIFFFIWEHIHLWGNTRKARCLIKKRLNIDTLRKPQRLYSYSKAVCLCCSCAEAGSVWAAAVMATWPAHSPAACQWSCNSVLYLCWAGFSVSWHQLYCFTQHSRAVIHKSSAG